MSKRHHFHQISKMVTKNNGRKDCQMEAQDLFSKLSSLREESYRQISDIIHCHSISITDGISDLTQEVCSLQTELAAVRKEKSVLLETVDNLNGEIRQLNAAGVPVWLYSRNHILSVIC